jgi:hypothetical protein
MVLPLASICASPIRGTLCAEHWSMQSDSGFSAGLAIGMLLLVLVVVLVLLATVPIGGGTDPKPLINIRF